MWSFCKWWPHRNAVICFLFVACSSKGRNKKCIWSFGGEISLKGLLGSHQWQCDPSLADLFGLGEQVKWHLWHYLYFCGLHYLCSVHFSWCFNSYFSQTGCMTLLWLFTSLCVNKYCVLTSGFSCVLCIIQMLWLYFCCDVKYNHYKLLLILVN
jgi:hypothetical protein